MAKRLLSLLLTIGVFALAATAASACVGRILYIGALDTPEETLMAEQLAQLINERTGTTVKIRFFDSRDRLYAALKTNDEERRADIAVENTAAALARLQRPRAADPDREYLEVKDLYEKELDLIWLDPFGFTGEDEAKKTVSAPLVRRDVLTTFPLLPRVLNKLAGAIDNETYEALLAETRSGKKPKNVARDFLRAKKFI